MNQEDGMKRNVVVMLVLALLSTHALAADDAGTDDGASFAQMRAKTVTATVTAIDQKTRQVTLKRSDGKMVTFRADEKVKNLKQVKVGDVVTVQFHEWVAVHVSKPGAEADGSPGASSSLTTAEPGEMPAALAENEVTIVATVESIASDKSSVTLKQADGKTQVLPVRNPDNLEGVKVGDRVTIVASEALAISVERAKAPAPKNKKK
jgi:ribosomal 50S subunit-recycling heat shock protein